MRHPALRLALCLQANRRSVFAALAEAGIGAVHVLFCDRRIDTLLAFAGEARADIPAVVVDWADTAGSRRVLLGHALAAIADAVIESGSIPLPDGRSGGVIFDVRDCTVSLVELADPFRGFDSVQDFDAYDRLSPAPPDDE